MAKKKRTSGGEEGGINMTPMIDVVFQLVVFFMVSSTFVVTPGIDLNLPKSGSSDAVVTTPTVVTVAGPGECGVAARGKRHR